MGGVTFRLAVIGSGFMGNLHAKNAFFHPVVELVAVQDIEFERAERLASVARTIAVKDVAEILEDESVDGVIIASSTDTHVEYLTRAVAAGKAVYCEKPIALNYSDAERAVDEINGSSAPVMIGFNRRFDPSHLALKAAIDEGRVGKVEIIQLTSRGPQPPTIEYARVSGGQMRDQTVHFFDLLRWLTGDEPVEIYAMGATLIVSAIADLGDVDTSIVTLRMASGALCQIDCSRRTNYGYDERVEVFGSDGLAESRRQNFRSFSLYQGASIVGDGLHYGWANRLEESYYGALDAFVACGRGLSAPSPSIVDGLRAQFLAEKARESLEHHCPIRF
jgi:myo-inositol 2-dehydrogenase/D-chiro-inositol 1-dehydrogenase